MLGKKESEKGMKVCDDGEGKRGKRMEKNEAKEREREKLVQKVKA